VELKEMWIADGRRRQLQVKRWSGKGKGQSKKSFTFTFTFTFSTSHPLTFHLFTGWPKV